MYPFLGLYACGAPQALYEKQTRDNCKGSMQSFPINICISRPDAYCFDVRSVDVVLRDSSLFFRPRPNVRLSVLTQRLTLFAEIYAMEFLVKVAYVVVLNLCVSNAYFILYLHLS